MTLRQLRLALACLAAALLAWPAAAQTGRIFVSYGADGMERYASQPYDASYRPYRLAGGDGFRAEAAPKGAKRQPAAPDSSLSLIEDAARKYRLDPDLLRAIIGTESAFNAKAVSSKGAVGLMQVLPATAARYGVADARDPGANVEAGAHYLSDLLDRFDRNLALALAAYNAGEGAVVRHGRRIPPFRETLLYVPTVLARYAGYKQVPAAW